MNRKTALIVFCYAMVYLVWGSTYFFIRGAVSTIPAPLVLGVRFVAGSLILGLLAWKRGAFGRRPKTAEIAGSALLGIMLLLIGNGLVTIAEKYVHSYVASMILACTPFYVAFFNFALHGMRLSPTQFCGALAGIGGIGVLLYDGRSPGDILTLPVLALFGSGLMWGLASSWARSLPKIEDVFLSTAVQMAVTGTVASAIAFATVPDALGTLATASSWSWFSVVYLATLGTLTLVAFNHLLVNEPAFRLSSYSFVNPTIAVMLGLLAGETATPYLFAGVPIVLVGLALMLYGDVVIGKAHEAVKARRDFRRKADGTL